jgi:hypothetical protein
VLNSSAAKDAVLPWMIKKMALAQHISALASAISVWFYAAIISAPSGSAICPLRLAGKISCTAVQERGAVGTDVTWI